MKLSIIIVNHRGWKRLRTCLESLRLLKAAPFSWEVIVVDNQSADDQLQKFIDAFPEFYFVENSGNFGFANGCNLGAKRSTGEYVLFLNPDTVVTLEALQGLLRNAQDHPEFTIISCSQVTDQGKDDRPYGLFLAPRTLTSFIRTFYKLTHRNLATTTLKSGDQVIFPDWVSGSVMLMSRMKFNQLGGWSEDFWMYYEDTDLCKRVWEMGGRVALISNLQIIHNHGGASRINMDIKALTKSEVIISRHLYIHKHFRGLKRLLMQTYFVFNNLLVGQLVLAILGLVFFFKKSLLVYTRLYVNIVKYYGGALAKSTWLSQRSINYRKITADNYETAKAEAA
jgi:GT2 family glycosyltransferase